MNDRSDENNASDNLAQYLPTWQTDGRGLGATPPQDTPPLAPAYGQVGAEQPDPSGAAATGPPPVGAPSMPSSAGGVSTVTMRAIVVTGGTPTASTVTVLVPGS